MIQTEVTLSEAEYEAAGLEAKRLGISLDGLPRRSLRIVLPVDESKAWMRLAGMVESGDPESSRRVEEVSYAHKE